MPTTEPAGAPGHGAPTEAEAADELHGLVRRGRLATLVVLGVAVALVGVVAVCGGFARRTDEITPAEPGEELRTGAYVLSFDRGTVQHHTSDDTWTVVVSGSGRTTADTSDAIAQGSGSATFVYAQDVASRRVEVVKGWSYGPPDEARSHDHLVPGLGPVELRATFEFPAQPQGRLRLVVLDQEYGTPYVFGDEQGWQRERTGRDLAVPLEVLPETRY